MNTECYASLFEDLFSKTDKIIKKNCRNSLRESVEVFSPDSTPKLIWDLVGMLFIFIQMITIPLIITFSIELDLFYDICNQMMDYYFLVDILVSFNTGYYYKQFGYISQKSTMELFFRMVLGGFAFVISLRSGYWGQFGFKFSVISPAKFINFEDCQSSSVFKDFKIDSCIKAKKDFQSPGRFVNECSKYYLIFGVSENIYAHPEFSTLVGLQLEDADDNWYSRYQSYQLQHYIGYMDTNYWVHQYLTALYFSITTMITIGYGDIYAITTLERSFGIFVIILSSGVFGYIMSSIVLLFENQEVQHILDKSNAITVYLKQKKVSKQLQVRIKGYMDWLQQQEQISRNYEQQTLSNLSKNLYIEIIQIVHGKIMQTCLCLSHNFSSPTLQKLAYHFKESTFSPQDSIITQGDTEDKSLYYIINGQVTISNIHIELNSKQYFGEIGFFANVPRSSTIQAATFINLLVLSRNKFVSLLSAEDLEKYFEIKFEIEIEQNLTKLQLRCYLCEEPGHIAANCPFSHYVISKYQRIEIVQKFQFQVKTSRKNRKKLNTLLLINHPKNISALTKIEREMLNIEYFLKKKYQMTKYQLTQKMYRKLKIRDSYICESLKEYIRFTPTSNLGTIIKTVNSTAEELTKVLEQRREQERQKRIKDNADKFLKMLQMKKQNKPQPQQSHLKKSRLSIDNIVKMVQREILRKPSEENRRRLFQVQEKRQKLQKSYNSFESGGKIFLSFPALPIDATESPAQELKTFNKRIRSTYASTNVTIIEEPYPDGIPRHFYRSQSQEKQTSKASLFYSTTCLKNMIYVVINHKLYNQK